MRSWVHLREIFARECLFPIEKKKTDKNSIMIGGVLILGGKGRKKARKKGKTGEKVYLNRVLSWSLVCGGDRFEHKQGDVFLSLSAFRVIRYDRRNSKTKRALIVG